MLAIGQLTKGSSPHSTRLSSEEGRIATLNRFSLLVYDEECGMGMTRSTLQDVNDASTGLSASMLACLRRTTLLFPHCRQPDTVPIQHDVSQARPKPVSQAVFARSSEGSAIYETRAASIIMLTVLNIGHGVLYGRWNMLAKSWSWSERELASRSEVKLLGDLVRQKGGARATCRDCWLLTNTTFLVLT